MTKSTFPIRRPLPSAPILIIAGDKGGIGKSFVARAGAAWLRRGGYAVEGYDGDARNAHLDRFHGASMKVSRPYLRDTKGWDQMLNDWEAVDHETVILIDTPAGIGDMMHREASRVSAVAAALGRPIILVWVADEEDDSIVLFELQRGLTVPARTLFALNGRFGAAAADFSLWISSDVRRDHQAAGGAETLIPELRIGVRTKIRRARCPFDDVASAGLSITEQVDLDHWWAKIEKAFAPLAEMLSGGRP